MESIFSKKQFNFCSVEEKLRRRFHSNLHTPDSNHRSYHYLIVVVALEVLYKYKSVCPYLT